MCTLTLVLPECPPIDNLAHRVEPLTTGSSLPGPVWLDECHLVYYNDGWYFRFYCQTRQLVLDGVSDFNPLVGCRQLPLNTALDWVAMAEVERLVVKWRDYHVAASLGSELLKALRQQQGARFCVSPWALWNYYDSTHASSRECFRELVGLVENALLTPAKVLQVTTTRQKQGMSVLVEDREGAGFKCRLSPARLRITRAAPRNNFSIHAFRNHQIHITVHCLERFISRVPEASGGVNPLLARSQLLKFIKNRPVYNSYRLGRTVFLNVDGYIFIGALSAGRINLLTVYHETRLDIGKFQSNLLDTLSETKTLSH